MSTLRGKDFNQVSQNSAKWKKGEAAFQEDQQEQRHRESDNDHS